MTERGDEWRNDRGILRTTRWSLVRRACIGAKAMNEWASASWYPLYVWARRKECSPEDAADAVQEFLGKLCTGGLLGQADPSRGKFRSWILTGFTNHLRSRHARAARQKRGAGAEHLPLDPGEAESFYQQDIAGLGDPDKAYTRAWALTLMDEALERLELHFKSSGRDALFTALLPALERPLPDSTYEETAANLGLSGPALRQAAVRFRQRYRRLLLDVAGERLGITCEAKLSDELRELLGA